jgi:inner membrane protein
MDNICHTLVGVAASRAGLNTKTQLATATLAISANLPDIDVLAFVSGIPAVALRRGWTHGVLAQLLLPVAFAAVMYAIGRRKRQLNPAAAAAHFGWLLALSYFGVLTHVFFDYLNTYGVRLLIPLSDEWFYGDSVFIIDPWLWLFLGLGAFLAGVRRRWPARMGLTLATIYIGVMLASARAARTIVEDRWIETFGAPPMKLMVGPAPFNPLRKTIIVDTGDRYMRGGFGWYPRDIRFDPVSIPKNDRSPWVAAARQEEPDFDAILVWSRFPYWLVAEEGGRVHVSLRDARFPEGQRGFGKSTTITKR